MCSTASRCSRSPSTASCRRRRRSSPTGAPTSSRSSARPATRCATSWRVGFVADTGDFNFLFEQFNRNKRGVAIDLRNDDGRAALDRLIEWADVFITNFLPSARDEAAARSRRHLGGQPALRLRDRLGSGPRGSRRRPGRLRRGVVLGARRARAHAHARRARRSCSRAARSATLRAARTSPAASRPRCASASAPASRPSSTCRCSAPRCGRSSIDLVPTTILRRRAPSAHVAGQGAAAACSSAPTAPPTNAGSASTCSTPNGTGNRRAARSGSSELLDEPEYATARDARRAHAPSCTRSSSTASAHCRSRELKERLRRGRHDLLDDRVAGRGDRRPAGARERLHAAHPGPSDRRGSSSSPMQFDGSGLEIRRRRARRSASTPTRCFRELGIDDAEIARLRERERSREDRPVAAAADDLGGRPQLPRPRGRDRPAAARVPDVVREVAELGDRVTDEPIVVPPHVTRARLRRRARGRDRPTRARRRRRRRARLRRGRHRRARRVGPRSPVHDRPVQRGRSRSTRSARSARRSCRSTRSISRAASRSRRG